MCSLYIYKHIFSTAGALVFKQSKGRIPEKNLLFFWILSKWEGGRALPMFFVTFS